MGSSFCAGQPVAFSEAGPKLVPARPGSIQLLALRGWPAAGADLSSVFWSSRRSCSGSRVSQGCEQRLSAPAWHLQEGPGQTLVPGEHLWPLLKEKVISQQQKARFVKWHPLDPQPADTPATAPAWHTQHPAVYSGERVGSTGTRYFENCLQTQTQQSNTSREL